MFNNDYLTYPLLYLEVNWISSKTDNLPIAPRNSNILAITIAHLIDSVFVPTTVPKLLATSLAPIPQESTNDVIPDTITIHNILIFVHFFSMI